MSSAPDSGGPGMLSQWCARHLGARPVHMFLAAPASGSVWSVDLEDGRRVALRILPASPRLEACVRAQRVAWESGIGCPAPLAGPLPLDTDTDRVVLAESWRPEGIPWPGEDPPGSYGRLFGAIVSALAGFDTGPLAPPPAWLDYDHGSDGRMWPRVSDSADDLETVARLLPAGLLGFAGAARARLLASDLPAVAGHAALSGAHVRWHEGRGGCPAPVVHGWRHLAARPRAVLVGCLMATYSAYPDQHRLAPVTQGECLLAAYQAETGRELSTSETEVAWAASMWVACHLAALEHLRGAAGQVTPPGHERRPPPAAPRRLLTLAGDRTPTHTRGCGCIATLNDARHRLPHLAGCRPLAGTARRRTPGDTGASCLRARRRR